MAVDTEKTKSGINKIALITTFLVPIVGVIFLAGGAYLTMQNSKETDTKQWARINANEALLAKTDERDELYRQMSLSNRQIILENKASNKELSNVLMALNVSVGIMIEQNKTRQEYTIKSEQILSQLTQNLTDLRLKVERIESSI